MNLNRDALMRMVEATRNAMTLSVNIRRMAGTDDCNSADIIVGELMDALHSVTGGTALGPDDDFTQMDVYRTITNEMLTNEMVADLFMDMAVPKMPKPNLVSRDRLNEMLDNCGYRPTPEGEWK